MPTIEMLTNLATARGLRTLGSAYTVSDEEAAALVDNGMARLLDPAPDRPGPAPSPAPEAATVEPPETTTRPPAKPRRNRSRKKG